MTATSLPGLEDEALWSWLTGVDPNLRLPLQLSRIGLGQSNLTYLVMDSSGHRLVLRRPPAGHLLESAHDVLREARILRALVRTAVAVPRVIAVAAAGEVGAAPLVLMEFVDGVVLDRPAALAALAKDARRRAGLGLAESLGRIHSVDLAATGLDDLASSAPYAERQLRRWSRQWEVSKTRKRPDLDRLTQRLTAIMPEHESRTLVHGDLHLLNVIVDSGTGDVRAVLDWELSTLGDPLADLGTTLAYWPKPGEQPLLPTATELPEGFPRRADLIERYAACSGRDVDAATLAFWQALALWKIAIIAEGVLRRSAEGTGRHPTSQGPGADVVDRAVAAAWDVLATLL